METTAKSRREREADQKLAGQVVFMLAALAGVLVWRSAGRAAGLVVFVVAALCLEALLILPAILRKRRAVHAGLETLDSLDGEGFERWLRRLFVARGYDVRLTPAVGDFGANLILNKDGERTVVQAKHWRSRDVGVKAVQEVTAARGYFRADKAMVVITGSFTQQAIDLAKGNEVELWDRAELIRQMGLPAESDRAASAKDEQSTATTPAATTVARTTPTGPAAPAAPSCPRCGRAMVRRTSQYGPFWGCPGYPDCRGTRPL